MAFFSLNVDIKGIRYHPRMIYWLLAFAYLYLATYFFIPLLFGVLVLIGAHRSKSAVFPQWVGVVLICVGLAGSVLGVPLHYKNFQREQAARNHFANLCETKAIIELPRNPTPAVGIVLLDPDAARASFLSAKDSSSFLGPGSGRYQALESQASDSTDFFSYVWNPPRIGPGDAPVNGRRIPKPTLPFAVRTVSITTNEDTEQGVRGIETTITDLKTQAVIARRVVYGRYENRQSHWGRPTAMCPENADADCSDYGCSVLPFVLKAVPPILPTDLRNAFDLYRGRGRGPATADCSSELNIGPGIAPKNIEWWSEGADRDWASLHLRIKGTGDHISCDNFFYTHSQRPTLRFADSGLKYSSVAILNSWRRGSASAPRNLADTR